MKKVIKVRANDDFTLDLTFNDGSVRQFDAEPYLDYPAFRSLRDRKSFCDVRIGHGTVQWGEGQDISPDTLYLESVLIGEKVTA